MDQSEVIEIFRKAGAYLEGHFILTSGLRSPIFLQKARVFMHPDLTERLCRALADKIRAAVPGQIDYIVGPAVGGLIPAYETSRHLGPPAIYVERESQRPIVLGKGGQTLKWIGQKAREELNEILGRPVHLFLTVKVDPKWQDSRALYAQFGLDFDV